MFELDALTSEPFPSLVRMKESKRCSPLSRSHSGYGNVPKSKASGVFPRIPAALPAPRPEHAAGPASPADFLRGRRPFP